MTILLREGEFCMARPRDFRPDARVAAFGCMYTDDDGIRRYMRLHFKDTTAGRRTFNKSDDTDWWLSDACIHDNDSVVVIGFVRDLLRPGGPRTIVLGNPKSFPRLRIVAEELGGEFVCRRVRVKRSNLKLVREAKAQLVVADRQLPELKNKLPVVIVHP